MGLCFCPGIFLMEDRIVSARRGAFLSPEKRKLWYCILIDFQYIDIFGRKIMKTAYINGILLDGTKDMVPQKGKTVIVENGRITDIISSDELVPSGCEIVNLRGCYLMPGLINLHVHLNSGGKPSGKKKKPEDYVRLVELATSN